MHGSYEALKYGTMLDGLADLTGGITESISIRQDTTSSGRLLNKLLDMTSLITCTVQSTQPQQTKPNAEKLANGIQTGINYRLYALERVSGKNDVLKYYVIRNCLDFHQIKHYFM